jgi:CubicO group peptidase (beta-lactamase class C family)
VLATESGGITIQPAFNFPPALLARSPLSGMRGQARRSAVRLSPAAVALIAATAAAPLAAQSPDPAFTARVDSIATSTLESTGVPSASVAVVRHGQLVYAKAYGNATLDPKTPATTAMRYSVGSISKQFAAASVLLLQQQGKLSINDKVGKYIPGLTRANDVTIRQLLSHTSGYQDYWPQDYVMKPMLEPTTAQEIMDKWARKPLDFEPGTRWQYSNTNFVIVGAIVEKVSGMPFFDFLCANVLTPLQMTTAVNVDQNPLTSSDPTGYMRFALGPLHPAPRTGTGWIYAAGELAMTPSDLAKWDISMIRQSLLAPASYRAMETEVQLNSGVGTGYGLGVDVGMFNGHRMIEHSGEVSGFTAENMVFPDDSAAVIVLTNQDAAPAAGAIGSGIARSLFSVQDSGTTERTAQAKAIFEGLQHGQIDRSLFTDDANFYFNDQALHDFASSLGPMGAPTEYRQVSQG